MSGKAVPHPAKFLPENMAGLKEQLKEGFMAGALSEKAVPHPGMFRQSNIVEQNKRSLHGILASAGDENYREKRVM